MTEVGKTYLAPEASPELKQLPKCNIHSHLEGSVRPDTLWELAQAQGVDLGITGDALPAAMRVDGRERSLVDYLKKISFSYQVLKDSQALRRTAFEAAEDAARDGVIYFELRAGPVTHSTADLPVEAVIDSLLQGLRQAEEKYGLICRLIISALRGHDPEENVRLAHAALAFRDEGVVGFDLAGDEAGFQAQLHHKAFRVAREGGLGITLHAGEAAGAENVRYAVEELQASRIGHGVRSIESPEVLALLAQRGILLEICPSSNIHTQAVKSIQQHPVRRLFDRDIPISIGDDDPVTSRTQVSNELTLLQQDFAFRQHELADIQKMSVGAAFLRDSTSREQLLREINTAW